MSNRKKKKVNRQQIIFLLILLAGLFLSGYFYLEHKRIANLTKAIFLDQNLNPYATFYLEIADTPEKRKLGLMFRQSLPEDQGMLFKFDETKIQSIWMKNTYISLDLVFLSSTLKVIDVIQNVPILNETSRKIDRPSRYILELNAGTVAKFGIKSGDSLKLNP